MVTGNDAATPAPETQSPETQVEGQPEEQGIPEADIDWKVTMLCFMKLVGESADDWHPELWEDYGITKEEANIILDEYEKKFK